MSDQTFSGAHSEWNLGSPGGWDYQRTNQIIGKAVWQKLNEVTPMGVDLDMDHLLLYPINGFVDMLVRAHHERDEEADLILVMAEEETLDDVTENQNLAGHLNSADGISSALVAPHWLEIQNGKVCYQGQPVSLIFMDFNTDVLLDLQKKHDLTPVMQAISEKRVINPRGTGPINTKGMFEILTSEKFKDRFHPETVERTPWTRQFYQRSTKGPQGEQINDLIEWTRANWERLVLKPERGYSGKGIRVGGVDPDADKAIELALTDTTYGTYIVQEKVPFPLWAEAIPTLISDKDRIELEINQTDLRCLIGPQGMMGFLARYGGIPTNVGSGGGTQPLAILKSDISVREATDRINQAIMGIDYSDLLEVEKVRSEIAIAHKYTYLLGPIKTALRPRILTLKQVEALQSYCAKLWEDMLALEKMWLKGELDDYLRVEDQEIEIAKKQPWQGSPAIIATDGLFGFGAEPEIGWKDLV